MATLPMYSQLMVAHRNAENKNEDTKEKVKALSLAATEVSDGSKELAMQPNCPVDGHSKQGRTRHSPC